jgi:dihydroorotate dehydrogenase electron transfer subunit
MISLAKTLADRKSIVLLGSTGAFPFRARPSTILIPGIPDGVIACMPMLEEWGIPSRLANPDGAPGCFDGSVIELASIWLRSLDQEAMEQVELFASGDPELVRTATELAQEFGVPCQTVELNSEGSLSG